MLFIVYAARLALVGLLASAAACSSANAPIEPAASVAAAATEPAGTGSVTPGPARKAATLDWPTYHHDPARSGVAAGTPPLGRLSKAWAAKLDGAVYAQPLVIGGRVIAATENDSIYGLSASTGRVLWRTHVGTPVPLSALPCGNIDPLGITGTPVYDPATQRVFAVAEVTGFQHLLVGVDVATGRLEVRSRIEPPAGDAKPSQQRGALALVGGRVYVPYGGLAGDCGAYIGSVASRKTDGTSPLGWAVPTPREGGIWTPGGPAVRGGNLYVSVGNGESRTTYDGSDSITKLSPALARLDFFAPAQWARDNEVDADLGSMGPALIGDRVVVAGKSGIAYLLDAGSLGRIGGQLAAKDLACRGFGAAAVLGGKAYLPCLDGVQQVTVGRSTLTPGWKASSAANGPPVIGGGVLWSVDRDSGRLLALDLGTGRQRASYDVGSVEHFASPALSGSKAYVPTTTGIVAVNGA